MKYQVQRRSLEITALEAESKEDAIDKARNSDIIWKPVSMNWKAINLDMHIEG